MLEKIAGGSRLEVTVQKVIADDFSGAIACTKGEAVYILLYIHHPKRKYQEVKTLRTAVTGSHMAALEQWSIDHDHGVWVYALYKDCEAAGLKRKPKSPLYDRIISNNYANGWKKVYQANLDLSNATGEKFSVQWFNPCTGGSLIDGNPKTVSGGGPNVSLGTPPNTFGQDWVVLLKKMP